MTRMTEPDCVVMCNLINTHTHAHTHTHTHTHKRRKERVGPVTADPDNQENDKEAGGEAQGTQDLSKQHTSRESMSPLSRLIRYF